MPGLSGLELIKEIRSLQPGIKIVIISGYDDFEYARTAIKCGVSDYVLKPVEKSELKSILGKIKETIIVEKQQIDQKIHIKNQINLALPIMCEQFLNQLIQPNSLTMNNIIAELCKYNIKIIHSSFTIVVFKVQSFDSHSNNNLRAFKGLVYKIMSRYLNAVTFTSNQNVNELVVIVNHEPDITYGFLKKPLHLLTELYKKKYNSTPCTGVSNSVRELNKAHILYGQAKEALLQKFWDHSGCVFYYEKGKIKNEIDLVINEKTMEDILLPVSIAFTIA